MPLRPFASSRFTQPYALNVTSAPPTDVTQHGIGYAKEVGFDTIGERGRRAADGLPDELVYAGFSLGVISAQDFVSGHRPTELIAHNTSGHIVNTRRFGFLH